jgi:hypothetical protein
MRIITLSDYQTMAIGVKFISAIELSEYQISYWRIQETIGLMDIGSKPQSIGQSDIGKNYRLPTSAKCTQDSEKNTDMRHERNHTRNRPARAGPARGTILLLSKI